MKPLKVGVLGVGDISDVYLRNLAKYPIVELAAVAGRDLEKARAKAAAHGVPKAYPDAASLIDDVGIDIVLNLTTPDVHAELTLAALRAGKHVYSEKPLAMTFADGKALYEEARRRGLVLGCAPDTVLGGRLQTCRQLIDEGVIGIVHSATAFAVSRGPEWFHPNPAFLYRRGGGPVLDIGPYYLSALVSLLGPVRQCSAVAGRTSSERVVESGPLFGTRIPVDVPTHVAANLVFVSGALVTLIVSYDVWDSELPRMELYGTDGTLCLNDIDPCDGPNLFGGDLLLRTRDDYRWGDLPRGDAALRPWRRVPIERPFTETSHRQNSRGIGLVDMAASIAEGRQPRASVDMALHVLEVMHGMIESAANNVIYPLETSMARPEPMPLQFHDGMSLVPTEPARA
ncbi:oxidoreductase [Burkholderia sp. HI2761]|uniref:Gfo/Idh/MocA family protein n=1 Tax=unclassified Burkholderia TaxID=2613784 RepID=UPI000B7AEAD5|nr:MULTISPECIES: Gfo/Idh/MocA family oxidoreductase [unclassified Burkholderia]MPV60096.1 gfo/Idh/MocA family oxidoreductase [Burkholderia sp. BE24]OXJ24920.1 oxidoreductase [Burkholderia sp. HI2761]